MTLRRWFDRLLESRHGGVIVCLLLSLGIGFATRLALLVKSAEEVTWNLSVPAAFIIGTVYDVAAALWWILFVALLLALLPARFFEFRISRILTHLSIIGILYILYFGAVAEWTFWDEFGVRFNFIAVDYLVYTTEVTGNIEESYPMPLILSLIGVAAVVTWFLAFKSGLIRRWLDHATTRAGARWRTAGAWIAVSLVLGFGLNERMIPAFSNNYNRELAKDGLWSLFAAFWANELDFDRFYSTMPEDAAFLRTKAILGRDGSTPLTDDPRDLLRLVKHDGPELRMNVIQITVESLSAGFLTRYGMTQDLTPNLDALMPKSLIFDQFYATGTRTTRGMEALALSIPPTPGRSLVKRPNNENLFTLGSVFQSKGYSTTFLYSGYGYFENMNYFFSHNGYRIVDRASVPSEDITFANVWGACDEDLYNWVIKEADKDYAEGKPFYHFVMTTSNHRPFTYPDGKIDLPSKDSGREGGVKYTDYAIGQLIEKASTKPWFNNTIFVIVADHCASVAGKTELPVQNYHIPILIYTPGGQIPPRAVQTVTGQMDFAPTLLGLLNWTYPSRFYGRDVLNEPEGTADRAYIGNYQKLGLFRNNELAILEPIRQTLSFRYNPEDYSLNPIVPTDENMIDDTIAVYQSASWLFKNRRQNKLSQAEFDQYLGQR